MFFLCFSFQVKFTEVTSFKGVENHEIDLTDIYKPECQS